MDGEPTLEAILASLGTHARDVPAGYRSRAEWGQLWQAPESKVGKVLRAAHAAGRLLCEHRESTGIDGRRCSSPVYAFRLD